MVTRELATLISTALTDTPAARTATFTGATVDTVGAGSLFFAFFTTTVTTADATNYFALGLEESEDGSAWTTVALADMIIDGVPGDVTGSALPRVNATTLTDRVVARIAYRGTQRYARAAGTETGTASAVIGTYTIKGHLATSPA